MILKQCMICPMISIGDNFFALVDYSIYTVYLSIYINITSVIADSGSIDMTRKKFFNLLRILLYNANGLIQFFHIFIFCVNGAKKCCMWWQCQWGYGNWMNIGLHFQEIHTYLNLWFYLNMLSLPWVLHDNVSSLIFLLSICTINYCCCMSRSLLSKRTINYCCCIASCTVTISLVDENKLLLCCVLLLYAEWPHRQGSCLACCGCTFESRSGCTDLYYARGAQGVLSMRVGGATVNWIYRLWRHCP